MAMQLIKPHLETFTSCGDRIEQYPLSHHITNLQPDQKEMKLKLNNHIIDIQNANDFIDELSEEFASFSPDDFDKITAEKQVDIFIKKDEINKSLETLNKALELINSFKIEIELIQNLKERTNKNIDSNIPKIKEILKNIEDKQYSIEAKILVDKSEHDEIMQKKEQEIGLEGIENLYKQLNLVQAGEDPIEIVEKISLLEHKKIQKEESFQDNKTSRRVASQLTTVQAESIAPSNEDSELLDQVTKLFVLGGPSTIKKHKEKEWKGKTENVKKMHKGYDAIQDSLKNSDLSLHGDEIKIQTIRGDNYCAPRSIWQSILTRRNNHELMNAVAKSIEQKITLIDNLLRKQESNTYKEMKGFLDVWNNRANSDSVSMKESLLGKNCKNGTTKEQLEYIKQNLTKISSSLNNNSKLNIKDGELMELTKFMMLLEVLDLKYNYIETKRLIEYKRGDASIFVEAMLARDTSNNLENFFTNHLNKVGDSGGLEQVEMHLLGATLGIQIQALRLKQVDEIDYSTYYNGNEADGPSRPTIHIVSEDDRHYNVLTAG